MLKLSAWTRRIGKMLLGLIGLTTAFALYQNCGKPEEFPTNQSSSRNPGSRSTTTTWIFVTSTTNAVSTSTSTTTATGPTTTSSLTTTTRSTTTTTSHGGGQPTTSTTTTRRPTTTTNKPPSDPHHIDTLDFFLPENLNIRLEGLGLSQRHNRSAKKIYKIKFNDPKKYELFTYDSNYIYLRYDNTWNTQPSGATSYSYEEVPNKGGRWLKRDMAVGDSFTVDVPNGGRNYMPVGDCRIVETPNVRYTNTLESFFPDYNIGGDLGRDEVIVLKYDWGGGEAFEKFYLSRKWGWFKWEFYENRVVRDTGLWNRISSRPAQDPQPACIP